MTTGGSVPAPPYRQIDPLAEMSAETDAAEQEWQATQTVERYAAVLRYLADHATPEGRRVLLGALDVCERGKLLPPLVCASRHHQAPVPTGNGTDRCDECWSDARSEHDFAGQS